MPRFYPLRLQLVHAGSGAQASNRARTNGSAGPVSPLDILSRKPVHSRDSSAAELGADDCDEYKRARASKIAPAPGERAAATTAGAASMVSTTTSWRCLAEIDSSAGGKYDDESSENTSESSIYSLASPWIPARQTSRQRATAAARAPRAERDGSELFPVVVGGGAGGDSGAGARTLCFDEERGEQRRFFSRLRPQRSNSNVSIESEPVDIPGSSEQPDRESEAEEEGWVSLWDTYTRLFPGTHAGCSPPQAHCIPLADSPLYATPANTAASAAAVAISPAGSLSQGPQREEPERGGVLWGQLSRLPLEEAERKLGTFSGRFSGTFSSGYLGRGEEEEDEDDDLDDYDDSLGDLGSSGGLIFDLEM